MDTRYSRGTQVERVEEALPMNRDLPDICDNNKVLAVSLVAVKVWEANFDVQVIKSVVFHSDSLKVCIASITRFCPLNNCPEIIGVNTISTSLNSLCSR